MSSGDIPPFHGVAPEICKLGQFTWRKNPLEKALLVACTVDRMPHIEEIREVVLIGFSSATDKACPCITYAFCKRHQTYFCISADATSEPIKLKEDLTLLMQPEETKQ